MMMKIIIIITIILAIIIVIISIFLFSFAESAQIAACWNELNPWNLAQYLEMMCKCLSPTGQMVAL